MCLYSVVTKDTFTLFSFDPLKGNGAQVYQMKDELPQLYNWSLSPDGRTVAMAKWQGDGAEVSEHRGERDAHKCESQRCARIF